ncbi:phage late control D family protein [Desulforamulus reducens MI-1]|uniref:Phage late control D family protein n=1 Tax=Desulforamulus reducens (strain ATCC BAA-1160 / DSM 100696 / MI-1) TaxID=349161 RepID=A4J3U7_DESRM|nr:contractile injection system protein, VgrG/Pvc8 family [Desulforamulus reducens]ABO49750.1 phage late control D family protein [Desulforamulus reducens MI-1]
MKTRRAHLELSYNGINISADLQPHLINWTSTDNLSGQADDIQITLEDRARLWIGDWMPDKGATLKAKIVQENKKFANTKESLDLGTFEIDEVENNYPPSTVSMKGISIPESSSLKGEAKNKAWEKTKLSVIAKDIANGSGVKLFYDTSDDPDYDRMEQTQESDLAFLTRLCNDAGLCLKVTGTQINIFDEQKYEQQPPITRIMVGEGFIKGYRCRTTLNGLYKSCRVEYYDANKKQTIKFVFTPPNPPKTGRVLVINERVTSVQEAERLAKKRLRQANREGMTVSLDLMGDVRFAAGVTVRLVGFGVFDGNYIIIQAAHSQQGGGYETKLELRKCLEGY